MNSKKKIIHNFAYIKIKPTLNNIFITITDKRGNVLFLKHAGNLNFRGSKKRTPFIAGEVLENVIKDFKNSNIIIKLFIVEVNGFIKNTIIASIIKKLHKLKIKNIFYIQYLNKKAHNGLRLKKKKRL